jgi:hypothetical protein
LVVSQTTVSLLSTLETVVLRRQEDSLSFLNFELTTIVKSDTPLLKQPVSSQTPRFVTLLAPRDMPSASTPIRTMSSERTSKQQAQVLIVSLKECAVHSERMSEPLHEYAEDNESSQSTVMLQIT